MTAQGQLSTLMVLQEPRDWRYIVMCGTVAGYEAPATDSTEAVHVLIHSQQLPLSPSTRENSREARQRARVSSLAMPSSARHGQNPMATKGRTFNNRERRALNTRSACFLLTTSDTDSGHLDPTSCLEPLTHSTIPRTITAQLLSEL